MPCSFPVSAFQLGDGSVVFYEKHRHASVRSLFLPCGRCAQCLLERSRQWAVRCVHESKCYDKNSFVTLTYDDGHLPEDRGLRHQDFQLFMKRLRRFFFARDKSVVRFFMAGEYGEGNPRGLAKYGSSASILGRPHYHAILFNCDFPDKLYFKKEGEFTLYTSKILADLWPLGTHLIGDVSFQSAAYVARYCMEKVGDFEKGSRYFYLDRSTGELREKVREYGRMSLKPGIGAPWLDRFMTDVYPRGEVVVNGRLAKAPRYYDKRFRDSGGDPAYLEHLRYQRAVLQGSDNSDARLLVKERLALSRVRKLERSL